MNKSAWRVLNLASLVLIIGLVAALLAQGGLWDEGAAPTHPDALTTLALVLAVMAFLIQIVVFLFQTNASNRAEVRGEELNAKTHRALEKIEADSAVTQKVLFSQFDRLLDFVVGARKGAAGHARAHDLDEALDGDGDEAGAEQDQSLSSSEVKRLVDDAVEEALERPSFSIEPPTVSKESREIVAYMASWPSKAEASVSIERLRRMPVLAVASLTRLATTEVIQRFRGEEIGINVPKKPGPMVSLLEEEGVVLIIANRQRLTDEGRRLARVLPLGRTVALPEWWPEVAKPLLERPPQ